RVDQELAIVSPANPDRPAVRNGHVPTVKTEPERIEEGVDGGQEEEEDGRREKEQRDKTLARVALHQNGDGVFACIFGEWNRELGQTLTPTPLPSEPGEGLSSTDSLHQGGSASS